MKLIREKFQDLRMFAQGNLVLLGALTPQIITSLLQNSKDEPINGAADFEFGWSGLQVCCTNEISYEYLKQFQHKTTGYLLEGVGYVSIAAELIEGFNKSESWPFFGSEDCGHLTELISQMVSSQMKEEDRKGTACIVQLTSTGLGFPETHLGLGVHVMLEVSEEAWLNLYQVHGVEVQAAGEWYKKKTGQAAPGFIARGDLNTNRSLN